MRTRQAVAMVWVLAACGGPSRTAVVEPPPQPLPTPSAHDAGAPASAQTPSTCLAPWDKAVLDPKVDPKPIDESKLAEIDRLATDPVEKAFARARLYFVAQHWVEAATGFQQIALEHPDSDVGIFATQLYLECLDVLGSRVSRSDCYAVMTHDLPPLLELYCTTRRHTHEEECTVLERIQSDILRLHAQSTFDVAQELGDQAAMRAAGEKYLAILRAGCLPPKGQQGRCDELAYNAGAAFLAAGDTASAERVKTIMLDPKNGMDKSPLTAKLVCRIGNTCP